MEEVGRTNVLDEAAGPIRHVEFVRGDLEEEGGEFHVMKGEVLETPFLRPFSPQHLGQVFAVVEGT